MLFNSYIFLFFFLPIILLVWWSRRLTTSQRLIALVLASYFFYGWWDYRFVALLMFSTIVDYFVGGKIYQSQRVEAKRFWLGLSLASNLGLLAFFKYGGFCAGSINAVVSWLRMGGSIPVPQIVLPVGISFYTFQTLSYAIDIYRGKAKPADSLWHFAAYVSLFPQLIAGPIVRYTELEQQLRNISPRIEWEWFSRGIFFFVAGLAQKILIADTIAARINPMFADYHSLQFIGSWYAMLGYTCQLYFDFAGYSNMAVGLGWMLGFEFPKNFDSPYKAANIAEFWRRWHISLSSFLRDYLFIPLGGSRQGRWLTLRNLMIVMLLGGLWHGAGWTFVLWGLYHGTLLIVHSVLAPRWKLPRLVAVPLTFVAVVVGWTLFRSTDWRMCQDLLASMAALRGIEAHPLAAVGGAKAVGILGIFLGIVFFLPNVWEFKFRPSRRMAFVLAATLVVCVMRFDAQSPFLYFQF